MLEDLVPIIVSDLIPKEKIYENDSENMSISQNDVRSTSSYAKIVMDNGSRALIFFDVLQSWSKNQTSKIKCYSLHCCTISRN